MKFNPRKAAVKFILPNETLESALADSQETLRAIRSGDVDALVVNTSQGDQLFTLTGADRPYRLFVDGMAEGATTVLNDGMILSANPRMISIAKTTLTKLIGTNFESLFAPESRAKLHALLTTTSPTLASVEMILRAGDGTDVAVELSVNPLDLDGLGIICVLVTDITERRKAQESEHFHSTLLAAAGEAIVVTDAEGLITFVNFAAQSLYGWTSEEMVNRHVAEILPTDYSVEDETEIEVATGERRTWSGEFTVQHRSGDRIAVFGSTTPVFDESGELTAIIGITADITERKSAEAALEANERWFRSLIKHSVDIILVLDTEGVLRYVSPSGLTVLGYAHDDLIGRSFSTFIHPQDLHKNEAAFAEASSLPIGGATSNVQFRVRHATGVWLWMETIGTNLLGDSAVKGIVINGRDVTETVNLSRGLQTLSQANQVLVRAASEATLLSEICDTIVDSGYPLAWVGFADSDRRVRVVGAAGETSALENLEISWGDDEYGSGPIGTAIKTGATQFINDIRTEASCDPWRERFEEFGLQSACAMPLSVDGDVIGAVMIYSHESGTFDARSAEMLQELTANLAYGIGRLRERNLLGEREALLREAEQLAHVGHWRWTPSQGHIEFLADGIFEIYGTTRKEWLGTVASLLSFVPFAERQGVADALDRAATGEIVEWYNTLQRPDEVIRQIRTRTSTIRDSEGRIEAILGACLDYTEQAMSNDGLLFQAQLLDNAGQAIIAVDNSRSISYWNRAAESLFGWRAVEVAGRSIDVVMSTESSSEQLASIAVALESEGSWQGELIVRHNNGKLIQVSVTDTPSLDGVGLRVGFIRVASDLSERRALEMRLDQAQRLESLGLLAGGVAHDFNNLLTVILNHGAFIERDPDRDARQHAHHIVSAGEAAARLTRQLLTFARREPIRVELLDLNQVMSDTKELLSRTIGDHIRFEVRTGDPATVLVDRSQLEQVLVNLAVNACDAMPSGGILTFDTGVVDLDENYAKLNPDVMPGSYGQIVVSDTGHGMSPEVMDHAFDPFYSTKALEGGTGLGLATVYGIAKAAGGHINLYSEIGVGTTVRVYFPIEEGLVVPHPPSSNASHHVRQGATVLIVEDLDPLREVACELIRSNGYVVLEASTPAEAIALATSHRIDLLLTDVMMPEMSGPALAELLASSNVDMSVVYMSGYSADFLGHHGNLDPGVLLVQKPFTEATLLQAVDVALGNRSTMDEPEVTQIGN